MKKNKKISLIGAGNIGGSAAYLIAAKNLADVVMFDIIEGMPQGKALDISASAAIEKSDVSVIGTNTYSDIADSDVIIVTAGLARVATKDPNDNPPLDRAALLKSNAKIITNVAENIKKYSPNAFVIVVTNPLDTITWLMQKVSGIKKQMVVGMAGGLDSSRFCYFLSEELGIPPKEIEGIIIGEHGDNMLPLTRFSKIKNIFLDKFLKERSDGEEMINRIIQRTKKAGGEIVNLLKTSAYCAPATAAVDLAESYLHNKRKSILCSTLLQGEYGVNDLCMGVPTIIGKDGVEEIIQLDLQENEKEELQNSVASIQKLVKALKELTKSI